MPSLFSRSRANSTPKKSSSDVLYDEFGRVSSKPASPASTKKKSKDKSRAKGNGSPSELDSPEFSVPDGSFLPLNLDPQRYEPGEEPAQERRQLLDYGYLSYQRHVVLGLEEVARLVDVVGNELGTRALTTPFIFSSLALDVSATAVKRLIDAFLSTCTGTHSGEAERLWREEAKLAGPQELGICLRWGLARIVRIVGGQEVRGLLSYDGYVEWAQTEAALKYPPTHFETFVAPLEPILQAILVGLLELLTRFTAHSATSGHTPPTLSPLFGPLLFGLGPSTLAFHHVYMHYLRAVSATEHLILSYIRWQDAPGAEGTSAAALGVPSRLKAWIKGYPATLPVINPLERPQPRRGARTTRVVSVRRNVRMYSHDLVKSGASWGYRPRNVPVTPSDRSFATSREWERICPTTLKLAPRYSDAYRKRMDLPANFHPDTGTSSSASTLSSAPSLSTSTSTSSTMSFLEDKELGTLLGTARSPEDRFRSLTDLKWGEFEMMGFGDLSDNKKLEFDLTEGARAARAAKRATLTWQDFSSTGFSRTDAPLSATLQFSPPVTKTIDQWPAQSQELHRKLKKTQKALPTFGWDTEPVMGAEEVIEEAFVDVFCDLIYGGGWMDVERGEEADRECNWALIEFKSLPVTKSNTTSGTSDPRTSTTLILFEEFVPLEYRQQLHANGSSRRRRLPSLFGTSSRKQWKPAPTLNGRPYVIGHVPHSPSYREVEFEGLLRSNQSATKIISLKGPDRAQLQKTSTLSPPGSTMTSPVLTKPTLALTTALETPIKRISSRSSENGSVNGRSTNGRSTPVNGQGSQNQNRKSSIFRSPIANRTVGLPPAEYDTVDFEARIANIDDGPSTSKHRRGSKSKDDAWVDILVAGNGRRLEAQDAQFANGSGLRGGRSDPEIASQEVSEVLAAVRNHVFSDDEDDGGMEPIHDSVDSFDQRSATVSHTDTTRSVTPSRSAADEEQQDEEENDEPLQSVRSKRLGYFDLHPDRRPGGRSQFVENMKSSPQMQTPQLRVQPADEPRASIESEASNYDEPEPYNSPEASRAPLPVPLASRYSPEPRSISPALNGSRPDLRSISPVSTGVRPLPAPSLPKGPAAPVPPAPAPQPSKTASLIEMYRERERSSQATPIVAPSKLPLRTGASLQPRLGLGLSMADRSLPVPADIPAPRSRSPSPSAVSVDSVDEALSQPIPLSLAVGHADVGLISSASRYVHGAPLHNVLEEEEEEEE